MQIDREALTAALDWYADMTYLDEKDAAMVAATRERLAQLPPYSDELVDRIELALRQRPVKRVRDLAVAVLDALNGVAAVR